MTPPAVILAGGAGRRLGGTCKPLVRLGQGPQLIECIHARLAPQCHAIAIAAGAWEAFEALALPVLRDPIPGGLGPLAGVLAALDWAAAQGASEVVTVPGDTPFLPDDLVARLVGAGAPAVAVSQGRVHPTCGLWPVALREPLARALTAGERRIGRWAAAQGAVEVTFDAAPDPFFNVNTPDDLAQAAQFWQRSEMSP